ncbi:MAG: phosphotransferase [Muribaculaceae bacterium]|nr:phosphotransferase [Muribaculaceae bacterium]
MEREEIIRNLTEVYEISYREKPKVEELTGGGSSRRYFRLSSESDSLVGAYGEDKKENEIFINLCLFLGAMGINVPYIVGYPREHTYLMEDLGDVSLFDLLGHPEGMRLSKLAIDQLVEFQNLPEELWEAYVGFKPFSERQVKWDLNYFKYNFLKPMGVVFDEERVENDFERLTEAIVSENVYQGLMYRDFQSRNVMIKQGQPCLIDFQGARKGPIAYDAVSFIWQARAPFSLEERVELENYYIKKTKERRGDIDEESLAKQIDMMKVLRTLQVLGAYGFRGIMERKAHFLESIPNAISNLELFRDMGMLEKFPELERISSELSEKERDKKREGMKKEEGLCVRVGSFSYKRGYPSDPSGNGGGFIFDCRGIHNPGRYEEYKHLTGKDPEVIEFLEREDEAKNFVEAALKATEPSVRRYLERGFTSLQVGFGCTGGQHRSVYCAERFARLLKEKFPEVKVEIHHRERRK